MNVDNFKHKCLESGIRVTEIKYDYDLQEIQNSKPDDYDEISESSRRK